MPHTIDDQWLQQLRAYLQRLDEATTAMNSDLDTCADWIATGAFEKLGQHADDMALQFDRWEQLIAARDLLLRRFRDVADTPEESDVDQNAASLREIAEQLSVMDERFESLPEQIRGICERIQTTREKALAIFVTQFHLHETTSDVLGLLSGTNPGNPAQRGSGFVIDQSA